MYGRSYLALAVGVLVLGILFQQPTLTTLGLLSGLTLLIAWGWRAACLTGVTYERRFGEDHAFLGERVPVDVTITNFKLLPLSWLETDDLFPRALQFIGYQPDLGSSPHYVIFGHTTAMRWFERVHWHYEVECSARGLYRFGTVALRSGDLFGLFTREEEQPGAGPALRLSQDPRPARAGAAAAPSPLAICAPSGSCSKTRSARRACASIAPKIRSSAFTGRPRRARSSCRCGCTSKPPRTPSCCS